MVLIASKALRAAEGAQLRRAVRLLAADDPDRHGQHVLLPDPGDQRARLREQDQARAGARGLRRRLDVRHHREPGRRRDGDDAAARRGLRLRHRRRDADHDPGQHRRHLRDGARDERHGKDLDDDRSTSAAWPRTRSSRPRRPARSRCCRTRSAASPSSSPPSARSACSASSRASGRRSRRGRRRRAALRDADHPDVHAHRGGADPDPRAREGERHPRQQIFKSGWSR